MFIGALFTGLLTSLFIGAITDRSKTKKDAAIGIAFTLFFSIGVVMISMMETTTNLYHILFGDILTVTKEAMYTTLFVSLAVLIVIIVCYRQLKLTTFDPIFSRMNGINPAFWHYTVMILLALITVVSLQTIGIILVVAMLITPASSAYLITKSLHNMMLLSATFGLFSAVTGIYISYILNVPSGACIVIIATIIYLVIFTFDQTKKRFITKG